MKKRTVWLRAVTRAVRVARRTVVTGARSGRHHILRRRSAIGLQSVLMMCVTLACAQAPSAGAYEADQTRRAFETSDGVTLFYEIAGEGPACFFIHGGPGQGYRSFQELGGRSLETFATIVYLDQRGSGLSSDAEDYTIGRVTMDVDELRRHLGLEKVCLIAHSFGGAIAVQYGLNYPGHLSRLILLNASLDLWGPYRLSSEIEFANRTLGREVASADPNQSPDDLQAARAAARQEMFQSGNGYRYLTDSLATLQAFNATDDYDRSQSFGQAVVTGRDALPDYYRDRAPDTALLAQPTLVIAGSQDHAVGPSEHERFRFPKQTTIVIEGGHLLYYENNDEFTESVGSFLLDGTE